MTPLFNRRTLPGLSVAIAATLALSGCSWLSSFRLDSMTDNVDYRGGSGSISSLEVPPGLTVPQFDSTYTVSPATQVSSGGEAQANQQPVEMAPAVVGAPAVQGQGAMPAELTQLKDGNPALAVGGAFEQVWLKTGSVLGNMGFTLVSQQRDQGIYSVTLAGGAGNQAEDEGFLQRMWGSVTGFFVDDGGKPSGEIYRIIIGDRGGQSLIVVGDNAGKPLSPNDASQILARLKAEFGR